MSGEFEVIVKFFASARDIVGEKNLTIELDRESKVDDLMKHLYDRYPELENMKEQLLISVNKDRTNKDEPLKDGDEIAVMPPVTGG